MRKNKPKYPAPVRTASTIMAVLAESCQVQSGAIGTLVADPAFDPEPWMEASLEVLDSALLRFAGIVAEFEERPANAR
jgi:hypothetical protein